jgi:RNA polymerase sigma factor (sigma-70 family)
MTFETLVEKISPTLKRITHKLDWHFTAFNEEDLRQEALLYLWQDFKVGKLSDKTDSYILQGCYFHLKNYIRTKKPRRTMLSLDALADEEAGAGSRQALYLQDERCNHYREDLHCKLLAETIRNNGLKQREKDALFLFAEGLTSREIGARLGISHVAVIKLMRKARQKCERYLDKI